MKLGVILAVAWTSLCFGERLQRSTVLTDESKRVLELFDFSNFDKQEALNYIDRQRYENQIRGKRSHPKRRHIDKNEDPLSDEATEKNEFGLIYDKPDEKRHSNLRDSYGFCEETPNYSDPFRNKRHRQYKKKRKSKNNDFLDSRRLYNEYKEDEKERRLWKRRRRRKRRYWDHWSEWSPCSVTCGRGRKIRWRKCVAKTCKNGELEMGEKTCQLPACGLLTKLLGI